FAACLPGSSLLRDRGISSRRKIVGCSKWLKSLIYSEYRHLKAVCCELLGELELALTNSRLHFKNCHKITCRERHFQIVRQKADSLILTVSAETLTRNVDGKRDRRNP